MRDKFGRAQRNWVSFHVRVQCFTYWTSENNRLLANDDSKIKFVIH